LHAIVTADQARIDPYRFVYVNEDGGVRELHPNEEKFLETPFHPADGARPYIKGNYSQENGWGKIEGFLMRSRLPRDIAIGPAPEKDPQKLLTKEDQIQFLRGLGMDVVENNDGSLTVRKRIVPSRPPA
jgi:hypothetical protein